MVFLVLVCALTDSTNVNFRVFVLRFFSWFLRILAQLESGSQRAEGAGLRVEITNLIDGEIVLATVWAAFPEPIMCLVSRTLN